MVQYWLSLWSYRKPIIGQVQGYCLAGGLELIAICDIVIASEDAQFGHPAGRALGIPPTLGFWPVLIGLKKTKELLFTGDSIDAREAERLGLVNRAVPLDQLETEVRRLTERIANVPVDILTVHKHVTNRWFEIMGLLTAVYEGAEFDSIYHKTPAHVEFFEMAYMSGPTLAIAPSARGQLSPRVIDLTLHLKQCVGISAGDGVWQAYRLRVHQGRFLLVECL